LAHKADSALARPMVAVVGDYLGDCIRVEGLYERQILEILRTMILDPKRIAKETAIDVGANIGNHSLFFSQLFKRVIAFEPNPLVRSLLEMNIELNGAKNIEVSSWALSDSVGNATLAFQTSNLGGATLNRGRDASEFMDGFAEVELAKGDDTIDQSQRIGLIKIDVEGAEESVLKGLTDTIQSHMPVIMLEQLPDAIDAATGTSPAYLLLRDIGYEAYEIRLARRFRGRVGKLLSIVSGFQEYRFSAVARLESREYPALIFTPVGYVFPSAG